MSAALGKKPSSLDRALLFARNFFKHPKMLGSMIPSSRFLINRLLRQVNWTTARVFVEYGPGVGVFTTEILRRMHPDAKLVVFETNTDFVDFLRRAESDPRLHVVGGSAEQVGAVLEQLGLGPADYIISGIPYSTMPPTVRTTILETSRAWLKPQGAFLVYQFSRSSLPFLQRVFKRVDLDFEPLNILPATLYYCRL